MVNIYQLVKEWKVFVKVGFRVELLSKLSVRKEKKQFIPLPRKITRGKRNKSLIFLFRLTTSCGYTRETKTMFYKMKRHKSFETNILFFFHFIFCRLLLLCFWRCSNPKYQSSALKISVWSENNLCWTSNLQRTLVPAIWLWGALYCSSKDQCQFWWRRNKGR